VKKVKKTKSERFPKTRKGGTQTEAAYLGARSALRRLSRFWKPLVTAKLAVRRPHVKTHDKDRLKWEYECNSCRGWFGDKNIHVDHLTPCGGFRNEDEIPAFIRRLLVEDPKAYQVLCKPCHRLKTNAEAAERKLSRFAGLRSIVE